MLTKSDCPPSLAARFQQGDEQAISEMHRLFADSMFVTAFSLVGDRDLAGDAVQQAFIQAWRAAGRFDASRDLKPWLYAITRRTAIDVYRSTRRSMGNVPLDLVQEASMSVEPQTFEVAWHAWQVRKALDQLAAREREVLRLTYYEDLTQSEISRHLQVPLGTVKSRSARAHRKLAALLAHLTEDSAGSATQEK